MEMLSFGVVYNIGDNQVRALPARGCHMFITLGTATSADFSNNADMSGAKNIVAADPTFGVAGAPVAAAFFRINGGGAVVRTVAR